jgi:hypothetical protein
LQPRINVKDARKLVSGSYRNVYQHPFDSGLLVKVIKRGVIKDYANRAAWRKARYGIGPYKSFLREIEQYLALRHRGQESLPFIQHFAGIVETDRGLGAVFRKVCDKDGNLAPTLTALVERSGLSDDLRARIAELQANVTRHHVVFSDIRGNNIVEADDAEHGRRLVIIDGLGDQLWLPVNSMSRAINRRYCDRRFARMMGALEALDRKRGAEAGAVLTAKNG